MAKKKMCKICGENQATVPDRNKGGMGRLTLEICSECHAARLRGDFNYILEFQARRRRKNYLIVTKIKKGKS